MSSQGKEIFAFSGFRVDQQERSVTYGDAPVRTTPKVFDLLVHFLSNAGKLLTKQQLLDAIWCDVAVEESALARAVCDLRFALARHESTPFIETVAKFGYRFVAPVTVLEAAEPALDKSLVKDTRPPASPGKTSWPWGLTASAGICVLVLAYSLRLPPASEQRMNSIAVLPFQVVGRVQDPDVFAVGMADAVGTRLAAVRNLSVRPASATIRYGGPGVDPRRVARELRVDGIVEGTMQIMEGRVRVTVRLVGAGDGLAVWSAEIERETGHAFELEREVAQQVAERMMVRGTPFKLPPASGQSEGAVRELYFRGRGFWLRRDRASLDRAIVEFQKAIELNPSFAPAHAGLADCFLMLGLYNHLPPADMIPKARAEAETALRLDQRLASAHATLGLIVQNWDRDWRAAETQYRWSIAIDPNYATAHHWFAEFLSVQGRFAEAEAQFREAERIDPVSSIIRTDEAQLWYFARNYERGRTVLVQLLELDPDFQQAHEQMALLHAVQGEDVAAWKEANKLRECQDPNSLCRLRWTAWLPGYDAAAARDALSVLLRESEAGYVPPRVLAIACVRQGRLEEAADWLVRAEHAREVGVITMAVDPLLDPLRSTSKFIALLRELHLSSPGSESGFLTKR